MSVATIDGVRLIPLTVHEDDRGSLFEMIHSYDMQQFGQVYVVRDPTRGTVRAFHRHERMMDYFCIVEGSAKFVLVRQPPNPKLVTMQTFVLSGRQPKLLVVPPGVYHGWMSLEDNTVLVSTADQLYDGREPDEERIPPDSFGDVWTVKGR